VVQSKLALVGSLLGFVATAVMAAFLVNNVQNDADPDRWRLMLIAVVAAPFAVALAAAFTVRTTSRSSMLLGATVASLAFCVLLFTLGPLLLPATLTLIAATTNAYITSRAGPITTAFHLVAGIIGSALFIGSFFTLFSTQDERCWETIRYPDGRTETRRIGPPADGRLGVSGAIQPSQSGTVGSGCTSDFVTWPEAALSLAIVLVGIIVVTTADRLPPGSRSRIATSSLR
jgi:hypothetical protein